MAGKYLREKFYDVVSIDGQELFDFLSFQWTRFSSFMQGREIVQVQVTEDLEGNLPLISHNVYNTPQLWWIIALMNDILDPVNDVYVGRTLNVPSLPDVEEYFQQVLFNRKQGQEVNLPVITV